ncbi:MAG: GGDEF domain-containing protein [Gammaproteobacteria bacterium]|nr:GGDEF domain-containing protein [Gammaproteobacteria bacterium]
MLRDKSSVSVAACHTHLVSVASFVAVLLLLLLTAYCLVNFDYPNALAYTTILFISILNYWYHQRYGDTELSGSILLVVLFGSLAFTLINNFFLQATLYAASLFPLLTITLKGLRRGILWSGLIAAFLFVMATNSLPVAHPLIDDIYQTLIHMGLLTAACSLYYLLATPDLRQGHHHLLYLAHHDLLTDTLNRAAFLKTMEQSMQDALENNHSYALMFLDLNRFKAVNDLYGHPVGDKLLAMVAQRLKSTIRESDYISRYGGDEFLILLQDVQPQDVEQIFTNIQKKFTTPFRVDDLQIELGISIGVSLCPHDAATIERLIELADKDMYANKQSTILQHQEA